ncbi:SDR family oxidoreductase [Amycolatopsis acidicola]|uniref:SDR family oxidoreductase n=1 Tax=Amycolatopsis acidicola TaxID=2596893 RepID=A0A5N0V4N4_9PSEU|nr:SDR family oxidoreductase [Amycolatopsis acidicola]KAA9160754.1 SDR family oxidoreductase [Amycolatopsis acidicola]
MDLQLKDRGAVVTGASAGIGRGIAACLAREGVRLAIVARRESVLNEFADELVAEGLARPAVIAADVTDDAEQETVLAQAEAALGQVDILANSAGGRRPSGLTASDEEWEVAMTLNFTAQRKLTKRFLPGMRSRGWGRIVYITGKSEPPRVSGEFCAKAAMHAWAKGLSREVGPDGVTVNSLAPGRILSEQMLRNYTDADRAEHVKDIPLGRYGEPGDIGRLVTFLASPAGGYITGTVIPVDGGLRRYQF